MSTKWAIQQPGKLLGALKMRSCPSRVLPLLEGMWMTTARWIVRAGRLSVGGAARFVRPTSTTALREAVEEIGGEAITGLHLSDELGTLP